MRQMDSSTLDSRLILRLNNDLLDVNTVQECLQDIVDERRASIIPSKPSPSILGRREREEDDNELEDEEDYSDELLLDLAVLSVVYLVFLKV